MGFTKDQAVLCSTEDIAVANATGAGDSFMGGIIAATLMNYNFIDKMMFAQSCSVVTIESDQSVCRRLSVDVVDQRKKKLTFNVKEKKLCI